MLENLGEKRAPREGHRTPRPADHHIMTYQPPEPGCVLLGALSDTGGCTDGVTEGVLTEAAEHFLPKIPPGLA